MVAVDKPRGTLNHPGSSVGGRGLQVLWPWPLTPEIAASRPHASVPATCLDPLRCDCQLQLVCAEELSHEPWRCWLSYSQWFPSKTVSETHYVTTESQAKVFSRAGEVNSGGAGGCHQGLVPTSLGELVRCALGFLNPNTPLSSHHPLLTPWPPCSQLASEMVRQFTEGLNI